MKRLQGQVAILATVIGVAVAMTGVQVDGLGAAMAAGFALMVMGWIQDEQDHGAHRPTH